MSRYRFYKPNVVHCVQNGNAHETSKRRKRCVCVIYWGGTKYFAICGLVGNLFSQLITLLVLELISQTGRTFLYLLHLHLMTGFMHCDSFQTGIQLEGIPIKLEDQQQNVTNKKAALVCNSVTTFFVRLY